MFTFMGSVYADSIGDIVESTGIGGIVRNNETLPIDVGSDIVLYDEARTNFSDAFLMNECLSTSYNREGGISKFASL